MMWMVSTGSTQGFRQAQPKGFDRLNPSNLGGFDPPGVDFHSIKNTGDERRSSSVSRVNMDASIEYHLDIVKMG